MWAEPTAGGGRPTGITHGATRAHRKVSASANTHAAHRNPGAPDGHAGATDRDIGSPERHAHAADGDTGAPHANAGTADADPLAAGGDAQADH